MHGSRRDRDDSTDGHIGGNARGNGSAHGVPSEQRSLRNDGFARGEITNERFNTRFYARGRKWAGRFSVAGKIGHENAQILIGEFLRRVCHDFFVRGETVK